MIIIYLPVYVLQAGVKAKKATETYKSFVEKYATAKSEFEQKMAETAQVLCPYVKLLLLSGSVVSAHLLVTN